MSPLYVSNSGTSSPLWDGLRPLLKGARQVDIAVAYATVQGARLLLQALDPVLGQGTVRLLVGCYLGGTRPDALRELLELARRGGEVLFIATPDIHFHPKVYRIVDHAGGEHLFVGSSNLSKDALRGGPDVYEWTVGLDQVQAGPLLAEARRQLEQLFASGIGQPLTAEAIDAFELLLAAQNVLPPAAMLDTEEPPTGFLLTPNEAQLRALEALAVAREQGHRRALVVAATGLGKTLLAALDSVRVVAPGQGRILVVAHRRELLKQAAVAFRRVRGEQESQGFIDQMNRQTSCDQVFASVWSLDQLTDTDLASFDYVVIDEAHHGTAASYRRIFELATPRFLLGLTATPERLDGSDVYALFHGVVACEVNLLEGIDKGWLVPFRYEGVFDPVDYDKLPWTGGNLGYTVKQLEAALTSDVRTARVIEVMGDPETDSHRTLVFCVSIAHAEHTAVALGQAGWRVGVVHSGPDALDPREAIRDLESRDLQVLVTVDMFNEGVDIPTLDRVLLLRPTDSPTVFLQQIGRGLRKSPGKERLLVIDLVGNHRRAHQHLALLGLAPGATLTAPTGQALRVPLPGGCELVLDVQVLDALKAIEQALGGPRRRLLTVLQQLAHGRTQRPSLSELLAQSGLMLSTVRALFGSWLGLLGEAKLLSSSDQELLASARAQEILDDVEETPMTGPHKMLLLGSMAQAGLATVSFAQARSLAQPYANTFGSGVWTPAINKAFPDEYPVAVLVKAHPSWCHAQAKSFSMGLPPALSAPLLQAIAERAEARMRQWLWRQSSPAGVKAKVVKNGTSLCLMLDKTEARKLGAPGTWIGLQRAGEVWFGKVMAVAINILQAEPASTGPNQATSALLSLTGSASFEQAQGRQLLLSPCQGDNPSVSWFEVREW